ncbi:MAG: leucyl aminopeptidase [Rhodobiaceae bacterium]|nr:leucyl aminopeptidase [Rhodobiaceae bacterium]
MKISFQDKILIEDGALVVFFNDKLSLLFPENDQKKIIEKIFKKAIKSVNFKSNNTNIIDLIAPSNINYNRLIFLNLGDIDSKSEYDWIKIGGKIMSFSLNNNINKINIIFEYTKTVAFLVKIPSLIVYGSQLRDYSFLKYKTSSNFKNNYIKSLCFQTTHANTSDRAYNELKHILAGVNLARDLVNEPSNVLFPEEFAKRIESIKEFKLKISTLSRKKIEKEGMGGILAVSRGSPFDPNVCVIEYNGGSNTKPLVFLGKGVTFDSGGVSIKPAGNMGEMKGDMAGAAAVVGLMISIAGRKANVNVIGIVGLVENMTDGNAMRPGDVITSMSGKTVEVLNTDAEGRLVLADIITYARKYFDPALMIDLATLTGAVIVALGQHNAGLFSNDDELSKKLIKAGIDTSETLWRMPLSDDYDKMINSKVADMKNIGGRDAGSVTAAQFIKRYVGDVPWAHIDIAGTSIESLKSDINTSWGSGYGVRLLDNFIKQNFED